jgi:hypothetical protein
MKITPPDEGMIHFAMNVCKQKSSDVHILKCRLQIGAVKKHLHIVLVRNEIYDVMLMVWVKHLKVSYQSMFFKRWVGNLGKVFQFMDWGGCKLTVAPSGAFRFSSTSRRPSVLPTLTMIRFPAGKGLFYYRHYTQAGSEAHPAPIVWVPALILEVKRPNREADHLPP